jgi:hypothetical protein
VTRVDVYDNTGGFEHQQTNDDDLDEPAWAHNNSELVKPKKCTWRRPVPAVSSKGLTCVVPGAVAADVLPILRGQNS